MILLTILKWLGIALLCVLALLLVLCLCILFVPVRYHISVTCMDRWKEGNKAQDLWISGVCQRKCSAQKKKTQEKGIRGAGRIP